MSIIERLREVAETLEKIVADLDTEVTGRESANRILDVVSQIYESCEGIDGYFNELEVDDENSEID